MLNKEIKDEILDCLKKEKVHKIILFGSHAYGSPYSDSDIDLLIVSDNEGMSRTYKEYLKNKNSISKKLDHWLNPPSKACMTSFNMAGTPKQK